MHCNVIKFKFVNEQVMSVVILKNFSYLISSFTLIVMIMTSVSSWNLGYASSVAQNSDVIALNRNTTPNNYTNNDVINSTSCNCVVFRMDDLQDNWIRPAQITGMNLFLSKSIPLSLAIIMNSIGNDSQIIDKIKAGINRPNALFELGLHGWNHVNYANLSERGQEDTLKKANAKMVQLFGSKSN
ncbi:MAG TPA: hypothetical protein VEL70_02475, partial [Candidatus Acidoferrum sp.]|nr:hypothetical protein [Candidatus Acidoferrum sp.]